jgi:hypothetical protein
MCDDEYEGTMNEKKTSIRVELAKFEQPLDYQLS